MDEIHKVSKRCRGPRQTSDCNQENFYFMFAPVLQFTSFDQSEDGLDHSCAMDVSDTIGSFNGDDTDDEDDDLMDI